MVKRISAVLLLVIANFILLVHAVIPHHNHKGEFCIEETQCQSESINHNHCESDHQHNNDNSSTFCGLKQILVIPQSQNLSQQNHWDYKDINDYIFIQCAWFKPSFDRLSFSHFSEFSNGDIYFFYTLLIGEHFSLRGPPIV